MTIYHASTPKKKRNYHEYRRIWIEHNGPIPVDERGRSYEIHHIDGDCENNDISNLLCLSIKDHYELHKKQGDIGAAKLIAMNLELSAEEKSELSRKSFELQIDRGTFNWSDKEWAKARTKKLLDEGRHPLQGSNHHQYDHTVYCFENKLTGETVNMTRYELYTTYSLEQRNVTSVVKGKRNSVGGWRLVK